MKRIPQRIKELLLARAKLRGQKKYGKADALRVRLKKEGYEVADTLQGGQKVSLARELAPPKASFLVVFGSGETAPSAVRIHRYVFERMGKDTVSVAVLSTPAGFQPNVKAVCEGLAAFFEKHLANFHPRVEIVYANSKKEANDAKIVAPLEHADYIMTGPGSPTYAAEHLRDSLLLKKIEERVRQGASLALASAAAMAFSRYTLPVYEIFKAGAPLHWEKGLNFYAKPYKEMTVIPHFNNKEGGTKLDTSRSFMGKNRFAELRAMLPKGEKVLGIDEHTAGVIDLKRGRMRSMGKGKLHRL